MIKYIHMKASIIIFQSYHALYHNQYITLPYHIILYNQGNSQYHWGALTPDYY